MRRQDDSTSDGTSGFGTTSSTGSGLSHSSPQPRLNTRINTSELLDAQVYDKDVYRSVAIAPPQAHSAHSIEQRFTTALQFRDQYAKRNEIPTFAAKSKSEMGTLKPGSDAPPGFADRATMGKRNQSWPQQTSKQEIAQNMLMDDSADKNQRMEAMPHHFNNYTSVISMENPDRLFATVCAVLSSVPDCEHRPRVGKYKVSGRMFWEDKRGDFMIQFFKMPIGHPLIPTEHSDKQCTLVEFQRRQGDCFTFHRVYREACSRLRQQRVIHFNADEQAQNRYSLPEPLPTLALPGEMTDELALLDPEFGSQNCNYLDFSRDKALGDNLVRMCRSVYFEPRREATCILARGSRHPATAQLLASMKEVMPILAKQIKDTNEVGVARNSGVVVANICKTGNDACKRAIELDMFNVLSLGMYKWGGCETERFYSQITSCQLGEALKILLKSEAARGVDVESCIDNLKNVYRDSPIPEAQKCAEEILRTISK